MTAWGFLEVPFECPGSYLLAMGNEAIEGEITWFFLGLRDNLRLPLTFEQLLLPLFCSRKSPHKVSGVCSVEHLLLFGHVTGIPGHVHTFPTAHLKGKNWTSVTSYHPCKGHFGNACTAKGFQIWAVVVWLLVLPASPCTCGLFLECQLHVQPVGCSWDCKWQLLLPNSTWWRGGDGEKSTCLQSTWLHQHACPGHYTCTVLCLLLIIPPSPGTELLSLFEKQ